MSNNSGYAATRPPKTPMQDAKYKLYTRNSQGKNATLMCDVTDRGNPRLTVFTNLEGDTAVITAPLEPMGIYSVLDRIEDLATGRITDGAAKCLQVSKPGWNPQTKRKEGEIVTNQVYVGRDEAGGIFISVKEADGKIVLKFVIKMSTLNMWMHKGGESFSLEESSNVAARTLVRMWRDVLAPIMNERITRAVNEERKDGNRGGGGNRGGNGGGYNKDNNRGGSVETGIGNDEDIAW